MNEIKLLTPVARKPRLTRREHQLIAAIERFDLARAVFLAMAADAAEFQGDPEWEASFRVQTGECDEAERELWRLIKPGSFRAVVRGERVYLPERNGQIRVVDVSRLP